MSDIDTCVAETQSHLSHCSLNASLCSTLHQTTQYGLPVGVQANGMPGAGGQVQAQGVVHL
jgi:hypothetical protein